MGLLNILGFGGKTESVNEYMEKGAAIIDVRTVGEYRDGRINGSKNIPLSAIGNQIEAIKKLNKPVIVCCASGMRSAQATSILKSNGIKAINGGGWSSLNNKLKLD